MVGAYGDAGAMKRAYLQNADAMRQVESLALEDQAVDWILDACQGARGGIDFQRIDELRGLMRQLSLEMVLGSPHSRFRQRLTNL